tara:strand:- start:265 stop:825 length:561 start_codon:yes stop_codon:yes gene_type:complete
MDKQAPTTSVQHNDDYSKALIESYAQWMDGDTFQGTTIKEEPATIETPIGTIPKPDFDKETIPTIKVVNTDDGSTKDPKANAGAPDSTKIKQSHGAEIKNNAISVKREEVEVEKKATREELEAKLEEILTELSEMTETTFTITKERWEKAAAEREGKVVEEEAGCSTNESKKQKTIDKIMSYSRKK